MKTQKRRPLSHLERYTHHAITTHHRQQVQRRRRQCDWDALGIPAGTAHYAHVTTPGRLSSQCVIPYVLDMCAENPAVWDIEAPTARALIQTEMPFDTLPLVPRLPFRGIYLTVPSGLCEIHNNLSGMHDLEGFYLVEDQMERPRGHWGPAILVVAIGAAKGELVIPGIKERARNDAMIFFQLKAGRPFSELDWDALPGMEAVTRLAVNFLWAYHTRHTTERPPVRTKPQSEKKRRIARRRGHGTLPVTLVRLSTPGQRRTQQHSVGSIRAQNSPPPSSRAVRGHWNSYWVLKPGEETVLDTKPRSSGEGRLHRVQRWIHPYVTGNATEEPQRPHRARVRR